MRGVAPRFRCASSRRCLNRRSPFEQRGLRSLQISAAPSTTEPQLQTLERGASNTDAQFEVIGGQFSLLSAYVAASQPLYTRKGTLIGFNGKAENAVSTLSLLEPFRRAIVGIPFIYQRITSTTPYTALIAAKSPITSFVVVHLDGRVDWMIAQRNALTAWTGHTLSLTPRMNLKMTLSHWGNTSVTGRGLLALSGRGNIHQIQLNSGEEYVVHPSNVIAYSMTQHAPQPYRFKANLLRFQIPNPIQWLPDTRFWRIMRESSFWKFMVQTSFTIRTWSRRLIWGDRLFLHFRGPTNILIQSRGAAISDVLTTQDVNEIADSPAGSVTSALATPDPSGNQTVQQSVSIPSPTHMSFASVSRQGGVKFEQEDGKKSQ